MIYTLNHIFEPTSCRLDFDTPVRKVRLTFEDELSRLIICTTEADMAALTGRFIKERLFGLH